MIDYNFAIRDRPLRDYRWRLFNRSWHGRMGYYNLSLEIDLGWDTLTMDVRTPVAKIASRA